MKKWAFVLTGVFGFAVALVETTGFTYWGPGNGSYALHESYTATVFGAPSNQTVNIYRNYNRDTQPDCDQVWSSLLGGTTNSTGSWSNNLSVGHDGPGYYCEWAVVDGVRSNESYQY
jgi:hypothetical protein